MIPKHFALYVVLLAVGGVESSPSAEMGSRRRTDGGREIENKRHEARVLAPQTSSHTADERRIRDIYKEWETAFRGGDVDGMLSRIDEHAIYAFGHVETIGREALRQVFVENVATVWKDAKATHAINGVAFPSSDVAIVWGNYLVNFKDGTKEAGHFMNVLLRRDGDWIWVAEQNASTESIPSSDRGN